MLQEPEGISSDQGDARKTSCGMSVKGSELSPGSLLQKEGAWRKGTEVGAWARAV